MPNTTQSRAGTQPQITAMAGPTIGAAPAIEQKWWPNRTCFVQATKSTPSALVCAGVGSSLSVS